MRVWLEAARPRTLPAGIVPVVVGTATADSVVAWRAAAALVVGVAVQVGVNYANDYFDGVRGVDTPERVGPRRAVAAGLVAPGSMRAAMLAAFGVAALAGLALAAVTTWWLLVVGAACFAAAVGYSGGPRPYAAAGLGELFVFVFFGLVATVGSAFVQEEAIRLPAAVAAVPVGLLAVALLVVNNLRDIPTDAAAGKATLAVRLGDARTRLVGLGLLVGAFACAPLVALTVASPWPLLAVGAVPLAAGPVRALRTDAAGSALVPALGGTVATQSGYGLLLAVGLVAA